MVDKNKATVEFLNNCPAVKNSPMFFNFINAKDDNKQFVTVANDVNLHRQYVDGAVAKRYTFTIIDYKSVSYNALAKITGYEDENMEELLQVQEIIDWITEQDDNKNYPDFGDKCQIDAMRALTDSPNLNGVDTSLTPALAKYSVSIQIDYIDTSKVLWGTN